MRGTLWGVPQQGLKLWGLNWGPLILRNYLICKSYMIVRESKNKCKSYTTNPGPSRDMVFLKLADGRGWVLDSDAAVCVSGFDRSI